MSEWISVEDRLPAKTGNYLVCVGGDPLDTTYKWVKDHWKEFKKGFGVNADYHHWWHTNHNVTHWQPLPEPPK